MQENITVEVPAAVEPSILAIAIAAAPESFNAAKGFQADLLDIPQEADLVEGTMNDTAEENAAQAPEEIASAEAEPARAPQGAASAEEEPAITPQGDAIEAPQNGQASVVDIEKTKEEPMSGKRIEDASEGNTIHEEKAANGLPEDASPLEEDPQQALQNATNEASEDANATEDLPGKVAEEDSFDDVQPFIEGPGEIPEEVNTGRNEGVAPSEDASMESATEIEEVDGKKEDQAWKEGTVDLPEDIEDAKENKGAAVEEPAEDEAEALEDILKDDIEKLLEEEIEKVFEEEIKDKLDEEIEATVDETFEEAFEGEEGEEPAAGLISLSYYVHLILQRIGR